MLPPPEKPETEPLANMKINKKPEPEPRRPVICADGLLALDILKSFSKNLPDNIFFSPIPHSGITKTILGDKLGVDCQKINQIYTWAANDDVFHVEVESPVHVGQAASEKKYCEWEGMSNLELQQLELDLMQFNPSWMKKELLQRVLMTCRNHPHGSIYKADKMVKLLRNIYKTRYDPSATKALSVGLISDGSLETFKGLPYILPVIIKGDTYKVNDYHKDDYYVKQEIKRINKVVKAHHEELIRYCKEFYEKNVVNMEFVPKSDESTEGYSTGTNTGGGDNV